MTVLQLLAFDVGTETLPALALGREPAEPGIMERRPRPRSESVVTKGMLVRAWLFVGMISAVLEMSGFFYVLLNAGWSPGDPVGVGDPLHHAYLQATTMTFLGMIFCQIGTAFAARTERASLRDVGVFTNRLLLWGIAFELCLAAALIYLPPFNRRPRHRAARDRTDRAPAPVPLHRVGSGRAPPRAHPQQRGTSRP